MNSAELEKWHVFPFGSYIWNISNVDSDIDIGIDLPIPSLSKSDKAFVLHNLLQVLRSGQSVQQVEGIFGARCPILRLTMNGQRFDISIADSYCLKTQHIINNTLDAFESVAVPARELIIIVKLWSKRRGINDAHKGYFNSYGFTLLAIDFLNAIICKGGTLSRCLSELVLCFFEFYCWQFGAKKSGSAGPVMQIIDPVNADNNVAKHVQPARFDRIKSEFRRGFEICCQIGQSAFTKLMEPSTGCGSMDQAW